MNRGRGWYVAALLGVALLGIPSGFPLGLLGAVPAMATPARIILLRHGEKDGALQLCAVGRDRARALAQYYIGQNAQKSLLPPGVAPKAILAISLHTLESIYPVADSWEQPVVLYAVMPELVDGRLLILQDRLDQRTQEAVRDLFRNPLWAGETLILNWEHVHIADATLSPNVTGKAPVTLYDLLGLSALKAVPETWPGDVYDYFWIIDFDQATGKPTAFSMVKQEFGPPFEQLPQNDWGQPEGPGADGCTK